MIETAEPARPPIAFVVSACDRTMSELLDERTLAEWLGPADPDASYAGVLAVTRPVVEGVSAIECVMDATGTAETVSFELDRAATLRASDLIQAFGPAEHLPLIPNASPTLAWHIDRPGGACSVFATLRPDDPDERCRRVAIRRDRIPTPARYSGGGRGPVPRG
jgi:hypothetical protein